MAEEPPKDGGSKPLVEVKANVLDVDLHGIEKFEGSTTQTYRKFPAFPCHFGTLGLERRHVRSPRTPGGLLRTVTGPRCGL
jgi:hypothetical protein